MSFIYNALERIAHFCYVDNTETLQTDVNYAFSQPLVMHSLRAADKPHFTWRVLLHYIMLHFRLYRVNVEPQADVTSRILDHSQSPVAHLGNLGTRFPESNGTLSTRFL